MMSHIKDEITLHQRNAAFTLGDMKQSIIFKKDATITRKKKPQYFLLFYS